MNIQIPDANKAEPEILAAAKYLRNTKVSGLKLRSGVISGKRVEYFKGKHAINALLRDGYTANTPKNRVSVTNREEASVVLNSIGQSGFILRIEPGERPSKGAPRPLQIQQQQGVSDDWYYMWVWEGSQLMLYVSAAAMISVILAAVMFPLWPDFLRNGVWYLSIGVLGLIGLFFALAIVRLILYVITIVVLPPGIWLFPNLFEDVGVVESFIPLWGWEEKKLKKPKKVAEVGSDGDAVEKKGLERKGRVASEEADD
jgi:translocation protein SEC62